MMTDDPYLGEPVMEVPHIVDHGFRLSRGAGILGRFAVCCQSAYIHNVPGDRIVPSSAIGNLPWIHIRVLIILNHPFHTPVQMYHVGIAHLVPSSSALAYGVAVPVPYLGAGHRSSLGGCRAVYY